MKSRRGVDTRILAVFLVILVTVGVAFYLQKGMETGGERIEAEGTGGIIKIGVTVSLSGKYKDVGQEYLNGLLLWQKHVNERGGIVVGGKAYEVQLVYYDDESSPDKAKQLYQKLISEDFVDFLISPVADDLTQAVIDIAEERNTIMIVTTSIDTMFDYGYEYLYQIATPATRMLIPAMETIRSVDPNATDIAFILADSNFARRIASGVKTWTIATGGYQIVAEYYYDPGTTDFQRIIRVLLQNPPDIIIGGGGVNETIALAQQLYDAGVPAKAVILLDAPLLDQFANLGDAALGVISVSEWEITAAWNPLLSSHLGYEWYGIYVRDFITAYQNEYGTTPSSIAAKAYAAGLVLEYALSKSTDVSTNAVRTALDEARILTFYGPIEFETSPETHGLQIAHTPIIIQWQERDGQLTRTVIAPPEIATATILYPIPWGG